MNYNKLSKDEKYVKIEKPNEYDVFTIFKDKENYKSPIEAKEIFPCDIVREVSEFVDNKIHAEIVQQYGVFVDKEELTKALNYDRNQYKKGWIDGYKTAMGETLENHEIRKPTNFDKITESAESFAKWFVELSKTKSIDGDITSYYNLGSEWANKWTEDKQEVLDGTIEWLQRECEL